VDHLLDLNCWCHATAIEENSSQEGITASTAKKACQTPFHASSVSLLGTFSLRPSVVVLFGTRGWPCGFSFGTLPLAGP